MATAEEKRVEEKFGILQEELGEKGIDVEQVKEKVKAFEVEVPSWLFGPFGGGRFGDYVPPAPAGDIREKIRDASFVFGLTGACPRIAIHVGWDKPEDVEFEDIEAGHFEEIHHYAMEQGLEFGAINPTLFLSGTHYGSLSSPLDEVRDRLIHHCITCCDIARRYGHGLVTYWLPDGSNYPGQVDLWQEEVRIREAFQEVYDISSPSITHLIEYKLFEPGTYSTIICNAGVARDIANSLGDNVGVLVDLGHHPHGVNIPQIVARLAGMGMPGGFHFNTRYAADDDHAVEPNREMFAIFCELVNHEVVCNENAEKNWAYMIDQASSLENRIRAAIHSLDSLQISLAKALILDYEALNAMREEHKIIPANRVFLDAFLTDVRPIVQKARIERGLPVDPVRAYDESDYQEEIGRQRS